MAKKKHPVSTRPASTAKRGEPSSGGGPIYRLHKIKIHKNRWLAWAIAYALIVAIAMISYIKVSEINFEMQIAESEFQPWHLYMAKDLGFSVRYPVTWSLEAVGNSSITFMPAKSSDQGVTVMVTNPTDEPAIRQSLTKTDETRILLDNYRAVQILNNLGNGHTETIVMALRNHRLYVLRGTNSLLQQLLLTFHFTK